MRIKVFKASDLKEAMAMVKDELGSDAVILRTKKYKQGGILGVGSKEVVEVTAAIDDAPRRPRVKLPAMPKQRRDIVAPSHLDDDSHSESTVARGANMTVPSDVMPNDTHIATPPRNVLAQYKTAGTEAGLARSAKIASQSVNVEEKTEKETDSAKFMPIEPVAVLHSKPVQDDEPVSPKIPEILKPEPVSEVKIPPRTIKPRKAAKKRTPAMISPVELQPQTIKPIEETEDIHAQLSEMLAAPILHPKDKIKSEKNDDGDQEEKKSDTDDQNSKTIKPVERKRKRKKILPAGSGHDVPKEPEAVPETIKKAEVQNVEKEEKITKPDEDNAPLPPLQAEPKKSENQKKIQALEDELAQMRQMLRQAMNQSERAEAAATLRDTLKAQELREDVMQDIIRKIPPAILMLEKESPEALKGLSEYIHGTLKTGDGIGLRDGRPKIVALIGTTGVGKTTTIAKIAAKFVLERRVSVALITADTYRISAVDQLKTYSDILGLPLEIVYSPGELPPALRKHKDKKLILIDTAGRSQNNDYQMQELQELLSMEPSIEKHLVLSATTKERDAESILERFSGCRPDRILVTKTDETESVGFVVNLLFDRRMALSYLTNGQSVPDDIEPARPEALARLLLR